MMQPTSTKSLIIQQDIEYGEGTVIQNRSGSDLTLSKVRNIYPVNSVAELNALDGSKFPKAILFSDDGYTVYEYNGTNYVAVNINDGSSSSTTLITTPSQLATTYLQAPSGATLLIEPDTSDGNVRVDISSISSFSKEIVLRNSPNNSEANRIILATGSTPTFNRPVAGMTLSGFIVYIGLFSADVAPATNVVNFVLIENCSFTPEVRGNGVVISFNLQVVNQAVIKNCSFTDVSFISVDANHYFENCYAENVGNFPDVVAQGSTFTDVSSNLGYIYTGNTWYATTTILSAFSYNPLDSLSRAAFLVFLGLYNQSNSTKTVNTVDAGYLDVSNSPRIVFNATVPLVISRIENTTLVNDLTLIADQNNVTITANDQIITKDGLNRILNANQAIRLTKLDTKWLEV